MELLKMMSWKWITQKGLVFIKGGMRESSFSLFHVTAQWRWIQTLPPRSGCHLVIALGLPILQTVLSRARDLRKGPADARQVFYYWHFVILFVFICLGQSACPPHLTCWGEGQRTILRSQFSPSTRSILELELRLPGLVASTLTYRVTLPNLDFFFLLWVRVSLHWPDWHWSHDPPSQPPRQLGLQACSTNLASIL